MAQQKVRITLPDSFAPEIREDIARDIINFIRERTATDQVGFNPKTGRNYSLRSKEYTEKYAAKKGVGTSDVDLLLKGDMLDAIELLRHDARSITIGFTDPDQNAKAEGNQKGTYGQKTPIPGKARPFLGISPGDFKKILEQYEGE
jgi:hypothetical protein